MKNNFQLILLFVCGFLFIFGVLVFAGVIPLGKSNSSSNEPTGTVTIWGTLPVLQVSGVLEELGRTYRSLSVSYVEIDEENYEQNIVEALASGTAPDLFLVPQDLIVRFESKVQPIQWASFPERTFKDSFIEQGELYSTPNGILGLPLTVDPLVLYYNRDLLASGGYAKPPTTWEEVSKMAPKLTKKDTRGNILKSTIALGEFDNITHAEDIISLLLLQKGNSIAARVNGVVRATISSSNVAGGIEAVDFYTSFSNSVLDTYSWNRTLPSSLDMFVAGDSVFYVGYASELFSIQAKNPNLNFDVSLIPQFEGVSRKTTFARMNGVAIARTTANPTGAFLVASALSGSDRVGALAQALSLPPVRRDLLSVLPDNPYVEIFFNSALISRAWLEPSPGASKSLFRSMITSILAGRTSPESALRVANNELDLLLR